MARKKRLVKNVIRLFLPVVLLLALSVTAASVWLIHESSHVNAAGYLVTPAKFGQLSSRAAQVTDETWTNADGTTSRGWLLRGMEDAPGIVMLHRYGADRSHMLKLGVKLNESTNFPILMPDQRGHGENPAVGYTSFGSSEGDDVAGAIKFLQGLRSGADTPLVGKDLGIYGVEMGAVAAVSAASKDTNVKFLVLDSVPKDTDAVLATAIRSKFPFASSVTSAIAQMGTGLYFYQSSYATYPVCEQARSMVGRKVLLLGGTDAPDFRSSTQEMSKCFPPSSNPETKTDLSPSGYSIVDATIDQADAYDQRVIDFFRQSTLN